MLALCELSSTTRWHPFYQNNVQERSVVQDRIETFVGSLELSLSHAQRLVNQLEMIQTSHFSSRTRN